MSTRSGLRYTENLPRSWGFGAVARDDAQVLILGSLPGQVSLQRSEYYAHSQNAFWTIIQAIFGVPRSLPYALRLEGLTAQGIALWDVCAAAHRPGSLDSKLEGEVVNDFETFLACHKLIKLICFNGATAARIFRGRVLPGLSATYAGISSEVLPSTSPAHASLALEQKLQRWREVLTHRAI